MEIKLIEKNKSKTKAKLLIKGVSHQLINTFRRYMMDEVPTITIEDVEIKENSSLLYDEMIAQRLGLIALTTDLKGYELPPEDSTEELSAKNSVKLTLNAKGPGVVLASDIQSKDPKVKPVYADTPIVKLIKKGNEVQKLVFEATAVLGKGKEHAKWSPGLFTHAYKPNVTVNNKNLVPMDFNERGFYAAWLDCPLLPNQEVQVSFIRNGVLHELIGGVARVENTGVAIAFRRTL